MAESIVVLYVCEQPQSLGIRFILSIAGYSVLTAANSDSALKQLRAYPVDLVLAEQSLVARDSLLAQDIKRLKPDVPLAVLVPYVRDQAPKNGAIDVFLDREADPLEFLAAVAKAVSGDSQCAVEAPA